jgi:rhodanese-related sulfurtransferase
MNKILLTKSISLFGFILTLACCQQKEPLGVAITAQAVNEILNDSLRVNDYLVIDTRNRMDYVRGHLVSAIWISVDSLEESLRRLRTRKIEVIVYDSAGQNAGRISGIFNKSGVRKFHQLEGGFANWTANHYPAAIQLVRNTNEVLDIAPMATTADDVFEIVANNNHSYAIIDARPFYAFSEGHIKNAISVPYVPINEFVVKIEELNFPRNKSLIVYCDAQTCSTAEKAADVLLRNDYKAVYILENGIDGWKKKGYPIEYGQAAMLD